MALNSITAALGAFVTGSPAAPVKQRKKSTMENSLRGSARVDTIGSREQSTDGSINSNTVSRAWQSEVWSRYDEVGEVKFAANFVGACLSRCTLTVGLRDSKGNVGPCFDENGDPLVDENGVLLPGLERAVEARELISQLRNTVGGQSQLLRVMGLNLAVAGEFHLVGSGPSDLVEIAPNVGEISQWEVLSTDEFRPMGDDYQRRSMPGATPQEIPGDSVHVVRVWKSHPRWSELPDSNLQAVRDILEELVLLTREVRGDALSRLSNGKVALIPEEIEWPDDEAEDGSSEAGDAFTRDLVRTLSTAISDKGSAAAVVPFIIRGPAEMLDHIRTIDLSRTNPSDSSAKRIEAVQRFAQGIDLPVEITTGHSGTSFANAVVIDDATYKVHVEPILEIVSDGLTAGYLKPAMGDTPLVVFYDSTELVSRPNRSQDAKDLHDRFALSDASLRTSAGFSESDRPDEEEVQKRIEIKQATATKPSFGDSPTQNVRQDGPPADLPGAPGAPITQGSDTAADIDGSLRASINAVCYVSINRAVRRAGARLRSKSAKIMAVRNIIDGVADSEVAVTLGPERLAQITGNEDLLRGEFDVVQLWALQETGDIEFAQKLHDTCVAITNERLFRPRSEFPFHELPPFSTAVSDG